MKTADQEMMDCVFDPISEDVTNIVPINPERPVRTRDGRIVFLREVHPGEGYAIRAHVGSYVWESTFTELGWFNLQGRSHPFDLFNVGPDELSRALIRSGVTLAEYRMGSGPKEVHCG